jgi:GAF domain-containing protein
VFEKIVESCGRLFASDNSLWVLRDDGQIRLAAHNSKLIDQIGEIVGVVPLDNSITGIAIRERRTVHYPHITADAMALPFVRAVYDAIGDYSLVAAPLLTDDAAIGAIVLTRNPPRPFTQAEIALISTFADQAVIAIENARLFKETEDALARQTATADILRVISSSPTDV